jgi:hypothetical protein
VLFFPGSFAAAISSPIFSEGPRLLLPFSLSTKRKVPSSRDGGGEEGAGWVEEEQDELEEEEEEEQQQQQGWGRRGRGRALLISRDRAWMQVTALVNSLINQLINWNEWRNE